MRRVIIIDDNIPSVEMISAAVDWRALDCEVSGVAYDGISGQELIRKLRPDLIITDIHMSGLDGLKMVELSKQYSAESKVIFITAYDDFQYAVQALKLHAEDLLVKPFRITELKDSIKKALAAMERTSEELGDDPPAATYDNLLVNSILDYINTHSTKHISLEAVANKFNYSTSYISALIKSETGRNFMDWVTEARIRCAKKLLRDPSYHIKEIAGLVGYHSYITFYNVFTRQTGITPTAYRNTKAETPT